MGIKKSFCSLNFLRYVEIKVFQVNMAFLPDMLKSAKMLLYMKYYLLSSSVHYSSNLPSERGSGLLYLIQSASHANGEGCGNFKMVVHKCIER